MTDVRRSSRSTGWRFFLIILVLSYFIFITLDAFGSNIKKLVTPEHSVVFAAFSNMSGIYK